MGVSGLIFVSIFFFLAWVEMLEMKRQRVSGEREGTYLAARREREGGKKKKKSSHRSNPIVVSYLSS